MVKHANQGTVMADRRKQLLQRKAKAFKAQEDLLEFAEFMHPDPNHPDDVTKSAYHAKKYHRVIAAALEQLDLGLMSRLVINVPPRHGKSELASKTFVPWYMGRHPDKHVILATYNEKFAWDFGRAIRQTIQDPLFRQVFPDAKVKKGAAAVDRVELNQGGVCYCVGRGGTTTGRGGHLLLIDDPLKDRKEADSPTIRESLWTWYTQVLMSRMMTDVAAIVLIQTRWHEDDLPGRLLDEMNPSYNKEEAKYWHKIDLPALAGQNDILGRKEGEPLWPERFGTRFLESFQRTDPRGFQALYQGEPSPEDGAFFRAEDLVEYHSEGHRPPIDQLRFYASSDHAVSMEQGRDKTCLLVAGVDHNDDIWIMPDPFWKQAPTNLTVEAMCTQIRKYKPIFWWAEKGHISKSIGPFLTKRMLELNAHCAIDEITPVHDKQTRAQAIKARAAMGKVHFPAYAHWWPAARSELLKFPHGVHDDFVDALALIGLGLSKQAPKRRRTETEGIKPGTFGYLKAETKRHEKRQAAAQARQGW